MFLAIADSYSQLRREGCRLDWISPASFSVTSDGTVKFEAWSEGRGDVPAARGMTGYCLPYCAPEVLRDKRLTERSQVYSVGAVFFDVLTGRPLFMRMATEDVEAVIPYPTNRRAQDGSDLDLRSLRPDLPPPLAQLVSSMLAAGEGFRPASFEILLCDLKSVVERIGTAPARPRLQEGPAWTTLTGIWWHASLGVA